MSKIDAMRAMREARYAQTEKPRNVPDTVVAEVKRIEKGKPAPTPDKLCGHRAISGKTCIRAEGHSEKSHRYGKADT